MKKIFVSFIFLMFVFNFSVYARDYTIKKIDNFIIIIDMSGSMGHGYLNFHKKKSQMVYKTLNNMAYMIPALGYNYAVYQVCGFKPYIKNAIYSTNSFKDVLEKLKPKLVNKSFFGPPTNLGKGLLAIDKDLPTLKGKTAVLIFSDGGQNSGPDPVSAAKTFYRDHNKMVCFHVISYATNKRDRKILEDIARIGGCGNIVDGKDVTCRKTLAQFVQNIFYIRIKDSDGDGVPDSMDWCPKTPKGVKVDKDGCPYDSDHDGIYDYLDKCPNTPSKYRVDNSGCPIPLKIVSHINFKSNSAEIAPVYYKLLNRIGKLLIDNNNSKVTIVGHTDNIGSKEYNKKLSERRALAIKHYLIKKFKIDPARIKAVGFGESMPIANNNTEEGRSKNRRVEFHFKGIYELRK